MEILIAIFGVLGLIAFILFYSSFTWGFIAHKMYGWFILSVFPTLPDLSILNFVGIILFLQCVIPTSSGTSIKKEYKDESMRWYVIILSPWCTLLLGYLIHIIF